jgi:hypothetical protein
LWYLELDPAQCPCRNQPSSDLKKLMLVRAELQWLRPEEGGRSAPPPGPTYTAVARLEALADSWPGEAWSIVAEWHKPPDEHLRTRANMRFLLKSGPEHLLAPGSNFELYEGRRLVARGRVLESG